MIKRMKMQSGEIPVQDEMDRKERERYEQWESKVNEFLARSSDRIHPAYRDMYIVRLIVLTGYWITLYFTVMFLVQSGDSSNEWDKPKNSLSRSEGSKIVTHYDELTLRRKEYFKNSENCTEDSEKVK